MRQRCDRRMGEDADAVIERVKNRLRPGFDATESAGYRYTGTVSARSCKSPGSRGAVDVYAGGCSAGVSGMNCVPDLIDERPP